MTRIPDNWSIVPISNILAPNSNGKPFQQGWSPQCEAYPAAEGAWGVLKTTAIQSGVFWDHQHKQLPELLEPRPHLEVQAGDLVMTCAGPRSRCGVVCLVEHTRPKLMLSGKMYRFRPNTKIMEARFLTYYIQSRKAQIAINSMKTGINDSGLNLTHDRFATLNVPMAPIPEQRRIIDKIDELFSELDRGVESLAVAKRECEIYRQAILEKMFSSLDEYRILPELLSKPMSNGYSGTPVQKVTDWRVLSLSATTTGAFLPEHFKYLDEPGLENRDIWCEPGDVLVQRGNTSEYVGVPAVYTGRPREFIFPDLMIRLSASRPTIAPTYLCYALSSPRIRNEMRKRAKGSAGTMPKINQKILSEIKIPYCDPEAQSRIIQYLDSCSSRVRAVEISIDEQMRRAQAIRYSILERAFSGGLVYQNLSGSSISGPVAKNKIQKAAGMSGPKRKTKSEAA